MLSILRSASTCSAPLHFEHNIMAAQAKTAVTFQGRRKLDQSKGANLSLTFRAEKWNNSREL